MNDEKNKKMILVNEIMSMNTKVYKNEIKQSEFNQFIKENQEKLCELLFLEVLLMIIEIENNPTQELMELYLIIIDMKVKIGNISNLDFGSYLRLGIIEEIIKNRPVM